MEPLSLSLAQSLWQGVNLLDAFIVLVAVGFALVGFWSGFIWQVFHLASWMAAFWAAHRLHGRLAAAMRGMVGEEHLRAILAFLVVLMGTVGVFALLRMAIRKPVDSLKVESGDRLLGAVLGALKAAMICGILALVLQVYLPENSGLRLAIERSPLAGLCRRGVALIWAALE